MSLSAFHVSCVLLFVLRVVPFVSGLCQPACALARVGDVHATRHTPHTPHAPHN